MSSTEILAWASFVLVVVGIIGKAYLVYRDTKSWGAALQVAAEMAAANLAQQGLPDEASAIGKKIGHVMALAGPKIEKLNAKVFAGTKAKLAADGIDVRALINEAFRTERP